MLLAALVLIIAIASFLAGTMYAKLSSKQSSSTSISMDMEDDYWGFNPHQDSATSDNIDDVIGGGHNRIKGIKIGGGGGGYTPF